MLRRIVLATIVVLLCSGAGQPARAQESPLFNVRKFGASGKGLVLDTTSINKAIDACAAAGGGTVYFPAGTYLSGTVVLKSNVTLWLDSGATLLGTSDLAQYRTAVDGQDWYDALILAKGVHNVAIEGNGTVDGNRASNPKGEELIRGPHAILFYDSQDIVVRDVTIEDSGNYALIVRSSEGLTVDGLKVHGGWDGINMHDVLNATISNCRLFTGDDSLAGAYWENVTVSNCILNSAANGIRVGGRNVLITNSVIYGPALSAAGTSLRHRTEAGFQILPNRGGVSNKYAAIGPVDNMVLSNLTMINVGTPFYVAYSADAPYSEKSLGVGRIIVNNVTVLGAGKTPFYISAPADNPAKSIIISNVRMTFAGGANEADTQGQGFSPFSILQSYGVYARNVQNLELHDVRVGFDEADLRPAFFGENIGVLDLDRFHAEHAPGGSSPIQGANISHLILDGTEAAPTQVRVSGLNLPERSVFAQDTFAVTVDVTNLGGEGLAVVPLHLGHETVPRSIWLKAGEKATLSFVDLRCAAGDVKVAAGDVVKHLPVFPQATAKPVSLPYKTFQDVPAEFKEFDHGFYIRAEGNYPVMQDADQYGVIYLTQALPISGSVVVRMENPDLRTGWQGRSGIMIRSDIAKPNDPGAYLVLGSSPAAGSYLEWASNGSTLLNQHTEFDGYTVWPHWLKLERHGTSFIGYSSEDGSHWTENGHADLPAATGSLDVGLFAFRDSARFEDLKIADEAASRAQR